MRTQSTLDKLCSAADNALRTLHGSYQTTQRENPAAALSAPELSPEEKKHAAGLMRINHCGEICAQALYQGQALTARLPDVRAQMEQAAKEENDHLAWCDQRLKQLNTHTSLLNPLWYIGSFSLGALAGLAGDQWSLGFVAETERQVVKHLDEHLRKLPKNDLCSKAILQKMQQDELHHAEAAEAAGGAKLPSAVQSGMKLMAKAMKSIVYRV